MTYLPLLLSLARFGSHLPPRSPDRRGGPSGKVGTIPRFVGGCACPVCDPDDEPEDHDDTGYPARGLNVYRAPVAKGPQRLTRAQRKVLNQAKQRREAPSRTEFAARMRSVVGERGKS
jgi:hypothetical protein